MCSEVHAPNKDDSEYLLLDWELSTLTTRWLLYSGKILRRPILRIDDHLTTKLNPQKELDCTVHNGRVSLHLRKLDPTSIPAIRYFTMDFLPAMASNHSSMTYKLELLKNRWVHNLLAICWLWAGPKFNSLLSIHRLIGTYFLTTLSGKHMHLLTRVYGNRFRLYLTVTGIGPSKLAA